MKISLLLIIIFASFVSTYSQDRILYNLDSYKRVDINLRSTFFSPDFDLYYENVLNNPSTNKNYSINLGGSYRNAHLINDKNNQINMYQDAEVGFITGTKKQATIRYFHQYNKRSYNESKYFKQGYNIDTRMTYQSELVSLNRYSHYLSANYEIGFGFGRLEVINNAWIGARILEELKANNLLKSIPDNDEMKLFFDLIGDLTNERVLDNRLMEMYVIEHIIEFVEQKEWIDGGSIKAFVTIYDAFRYEDFFTRLSGERLEFTLIPTLQGLYDWSNNSIFGSQQYIQPGFEGTIEYEIHRNGDLEYYSTKLLGGRIKNYERFYTYSGQSINTFGADLYFQYQYRYIPSLRTNLMLTTDFTGSVLYSGFFDSLLNFGVSFTYNYYLSPATQLVLFARTNYNDNRFQIGDFQPQVNGSVSFDIIHAIR